MKIALIEFIRPNGKQIPHEIVVSDDCSEKYKKLSELGFRLTAEFIFGNDVNICIEHPNQGDFISKIFENSQELPNQISQIILGFDEKLASEYIEMVG
jgi:hypothetical protein